MIDSRTITMGLGTIALACARAARNGATVDEVLADHPDLVDHEIGHHDAGHLVLPGLRGVRRRDFLDGG